MSVVIGYNATPVIYFIASAIYFCLFIWGVYSLRREKQKLIFLLFCLFIPIFIVFVISILKPYYVDRYFIPSLPFCLLIVAKGLSEFKKEYLLSLLFIIVILSFLTLKNYYSNYLPNSFIHHVGIQLKADTKATAKYIFENFVEGDGICHADENTVPQIWYYLNPGYSLEYEKTNNIFIEADKKTILKYDKIINRMFTFKFLLEGESRIKDIDIPLEKYKRIWLISCIPREQIQDTLNWLSANYKLVDIKKFYAVDLYLYRILKR